MALELLGGRALGPFFGTGIYVWGTIITLFMLSLSIGYLIGGSLSASRPSVEKLSAILLLAVLAALPCVMAFNPILEFIFDRVHDPRYGALCASVALFFLPITVSGAVSPYAVRLLVDGLGTSGKVGPAKSFSYRPSAACWARCWLHQDAVRGALPEARTAEHPDHWLGRGSLPSALKKIVPQASIGTVELDPAVAKVAERFFGFIPSEFNSVAIEDGRVFDHVYVPEHMLTREYLLEVKSLLKKDGVLAANTFSSSRLYDAESATYASVFGGFYNLKTENRVILATNGSLPTMAQIQANAGRLEPTLNIFGTGKDWLLPLFSTKIDWQEDTRIVTNQYSPANLLNKNENSDPWWKLW